MQTHEARSRIQVLLNFYKGLAHIEGILAAAESCEREQAEKTSALAAVVSKLSEANSEYAIACETHSKLKKNMQDELAQLEKRRGETLARIEEELAAAEAQKVAAVTIARTRQAEAEHEAEEAIAFLNQRKAVLEKDVKNLESALDKLRAKVASL